MSFIYSQTDSWNTAGTVFAAIQMNVSNGAIPAANPVAAASSQLLNLQTNGTQNLGVRMPHVVSGSDATPFLNLADTWNTTANITGIKYNVTNTASGASSLLMDLQVAGTSKFSVAASGNVTMVANSFLQTSSGDFNIQPVGNLNLSSNSGFQWQIDTSGRFKAVADNINDIGASGVNRPRNVFIAGGYNGATLFLSGGAEVASMRIDQAPTAVTHTVTISSAADSATNFGHVFQINMNGTTYFIPCGIVQP